MKNTYLVIALMIVSLSVHSQQPKSTPATKTHNNAIDSMQYVTMKDSVMMMFRNDRFTTLTDDIALGDGTIIQKEGIIVNVDGTKEEFEEGVCMDMSGKVISVKTNQKSDSKESDIKKHQDEKY